MLLCMLRFPRKKFVDRDYIGEKLEYQAGDSNILFYTFLKLMFYLKKQYNRDFLGNELWIIFGVLSLFFPC